ncbi:MAG: class I SAM-dependent methyltransferase [Lachnospiraceae bacterium]|nr:class I SAM-dependent methyltransferase [Lachnospiraceae bacterium]
MFVFCNDPLLIPESQALAERLKVPFESDIPGREGEIHIEKTDEGLFLRREGLSFCVDTEKVKKRIKTGNLQKEMIVSAVNIKKHTGTLKVLDATAGLGEDSFILGAAGFDVTMYEYNPVIAALLEDGLKRLFYNPEFAMLKERLQLCVGDSISAMKEMKGEFDVIFLDPMFPKRTKSSDVKKKFQLLQDIEVPCENEEELLHAALAAGAKKVVIKRPAKGPALGGIKCDFSYSGKAIRYDCIVNTERFV